ncbi:MAG: hypothetical protein NC420_00815 [Eubacterium sp.]|nr:hypothetical protein [Eubacterium sp.]
MTGILLVFFAIMLFSGWWIVNSFSLPQSDALAVYNIACRARDHDLLPIAPTGSYMSLWPFQSGLVLFMEVILRVIPGANEMVIQCLYMPFMALSLISGYMVMKRSFLSVRTRIFWCLLMLFCFPYFFYINNMYGEIPSIALSLFVMWMLLEYSVKPSWLKLLSAGLGMAMAVALRKNTLIFAIACFLVWAVVSIDKRQVRYLILLLVLAAAVAAGALLPVRFYEHRAGNTMGKGVPAIAYIAMGLQWTEGRSPGGWNGYHSDLFMDCSYDAELTARISAENAKDSLAYMARNPGYTIRFFYHKQVEQWDREDFQCLYETLGLYGKRTQAAWDIYEGKAKDRFMAVMSVHQSLVYLGAGAFCMFGAVRWRKRKEYGNSLVQLTFMVTFIGGFLFSMMWEAGSRYSLPYFVILIPYAAEGLAKISYCLEEALGISGPSKL